MDGGAWWTTVHMVTKSQTRLSEFTHFTYHDKAVIHEGELPDVQVGFRKGSLAEELEIKLPTFIGS